MFLDFTGAVKTQTSYLKFSMNWFLHSLQMQTTLTVSGYLIYVCFLHSVTGGMCACHSCFSYFGFEIRWIHLISWIR